MEPNNSWRFILFNVFFVILLCLLASFTDLRYDNFIHFGKCPVHNASTSENILASNPPTNDDMKLLIGISTIPDKYERRNLLRLVYGTQFPIVGAKIDVKFVFCNLTNEEQRTLIALEIMQYDDIIILNCKENMNDGKTYTYFSSMPEMFNSSSGDESYDYVMKADDDLYLRLDELVESLRPLPKDDLYYGFVYPCDSMDPFVDFMSGMGYLLSWDLVEWIRESDIARNNTVGHEDLLVGAWLDAGGRGLNRYSNKWRMYNYPDPNPICSRELNPDTIGVHLLKTRERWIDTLTYFNTTQNLKPSKLYHIP